MCHWVCIYIYMCALKRYEWNSSMMFPVILTHWYFPNAHKHKTRYIDIESTKNVSFGIENEWSFGKYKECACIVNHSFSTFILKISMRAKPMNTIYIYIDNNLKNICRKLKKRKVVKWHEHEEYSDRNYLS